MFIRSLFTKVFGDSYRQAVESTPEYRAFTKSSSTDATLFHFLLKLLSRIPLNQLDKELDAPLATLNRLVSKVDLNTCILSSSNRQITLLTYAVRSLQHLEKAFTAEKQLSPAYTKIMHFLSVLFQQPILLDASKDELLPLLIAPEVSPSFQRHLLRALKTSALILSEAEILPLLQQSIECYDSNAFKPLYSAYRLSASAHATLIHQCLTHFERFTDHLCQNIKPITLARYRNSLNVLDILEFLALKDDSPAILAALYNLTWIASKSSDKLQRVAAHLKERLLETYASSNVIHIQNTLRLYHYLIKQTLNPIAASFFTAFANQNSPGLEKLCFDYLNLDNHNAPCPDLLETLSHLGALDSRIVSFFKLYAIKTEKNFLLLLRDYIDVLKKAPHKLEIILRSYPHHMFIRFMQTSLTTPQHLPAENILTMLFSLQYYDEGRSIDAWSQLTSYLVSLVPRAKIRQPLPKAPKTIEPQHLELDSFTEQGWEKQYFLGRTLILAHPDGQQLAVKVLKKEEKLAQLTKEYLTTAFLHTHKQAWNLKSQLPSPLGIYNIKNLTPWLDQHANQEAAQTFKTMVGEKETYVAYLYKLEHKHRHYFTYLHDPILSHDTFRNANQHCITDLCVLLTQGFAYIQLADIFHTRANIDDRLNYDGGRYRVLNNLLSSDTWGSGRLTGWREAVEYPNLRASGLADLGDWVPLRDYLSHKSQFANTFYTRTSIFNYNGTATLLNLLAEYQYILFLIAGRRGHDLQQQAESEGKSEAYCFDIWQRLADQVIVNCIQMITLFSPLSTTQAKILLHSLVSEERLALQMQFWMTDKYISPLKMNAIPRNLYAIAPTLDITKFRANTFCPNLGCSIDGKHQDLGPVNGQEPIKEANKLFYWTVNALVSPYITYTQTVKQVLTLMKDNTPHTLSSYAHLFQFLDNKSLHKFMAFAAKKGGQESLALSHRKEYSALVIQSFWKSKQLEKHLKPFKHDQKEASQDWQTVAPSHRRPS